MQDCGGAGRDTLRRGDKHQEAPGETGRDAHRETPRHRHAGCRDKFRDTSEDRGADRARDWDPAAAGGCASHAQPGAYPARTAPRAPSGLAAPISPTKTSGRLPGRS